MTDQERVRSFVNNHRSIVYGMMIDECLDRGEEKLADILLELREQKKWPTDMQDVYPIGEFGWYVKGESERLFEDDISSKSVSWPVATWKYFDSYYEAFMGLAEEILRKREKK